MGCVVLLFSALALLSRPVEGKLLHFAAFCPSLSQSSIVFLYHPSGDEIGGAVYSFSSSSSSYYCYFSLILVSRHINESLVSRYLIRVNNNNNNNNNRGNFYGAHLPHRVEAQGALQ